ncbi:MAG: hypothetical protein F4Y03_05900 [Alphaproteobacteria bacterium]|nr:hypothetical protein [Alphaproteobacteria bacterium]
MSAGDASGQAGSYRTLADRFTERYEADDSWWSKVEENWREDDEETRIQLAPISRTVDYGDMEGTDHLTVAWKDGSAIMVTFLGTEDENWDFIDDHGRVRGYQFDNGR